MDDKDRFNQIISFDNVFMFEGDEFNITFYIDPLSYEIEKLDIVLLKDMLKIRPFKDYMNRKETVRLYYRSRLDPFIPKGCQDISKIPYVKDFKEFKEFKIEHLDIPSPNDTNILYITLSEIKQN